MTGVKREKSKRVVTINKLGPGPRSAVAFLQDEVRIELGTAAISENKAQYKQKPKNVITSILTDKKDREKVTEAKAAQLASITGSVKFTGVDRSIRMFYSGANLETFFLAVKQAYKSIVGLTEKKTGKGRSTYYFWLSDQAKPGRSRKTKSLGRVKKWLEEGGHDLVSVHILGPTVPYRRQLVYNPRGRKQQARWVALSSASTKGPAIDRYKFAKRVRAASDDKRDVSDSFWRARRATNYSAGKPTFQVQSPRAIQEMVKAQIKRQYRDVWVTYAFIRSKDALPHRWGRNIPLLVLAPIRKGNRK